jgi:hypothetical protein
MLKVQNKQKQRKQKALEQKAESLGIPGNLKLAEYLTKLEMNLDFQHDKIISLQGQLYSGR